MKQLATFFFNILICISAQAQIEPLSYIKFDGFTIEHKSLIKKAKIPVNFDCENCQGIEISENSSIVILNSNPDNLKRTIDLPKTIRDRINNNEKLIAVVSEEAVCIYEEGKGLINCRELSLLGMNRPIFPSTTNGVMSSRNEQLLTERTESSQFDKKANLDEVFRDTPNAHLNKVDNGSIFHNYDPNRISTFVVGSDRNPIEFTVEYDIVKEKDLKTRKLKRKTLETSDTCLKDYFRTSGTTSNWKVFDDEGLSDVINIVPGSIYDLKVFDGTFFKRVEEYDRYPLKLNLEEGVQGSVTLKSVNNPKLIAKIREQGLNPILNGLHNENRGAHMIATIDFEQQYGKRQLDISLGGAVPYLGGSISYGGNYNDHTTEDSYSYFLELEEEFFNIEATGNALVAGKFFKSDSLNALKQYGYVSKVTYGRRISVNIESLYKLEDLNYGANINSSGVVDVDFDFSGSDFNESDYLSYTIYLQGGATDNQIALIQDSGSLDDMLESISDIVNDGNINTLDAVPIKFTLNSFSGDRIVSTYAPIEHEEESCNPSFKLWLNSITMGDKIDDNIGEKKIEVYGSWKFLKYDDEDNEELMPSTTIWSRDDFFKFGKLDHKVFSPTHPASGGVPFTLTHDDLPNGYIKIDIDCHEKDDQALGNADDPFNGISNRIFLKDMPMQELSVEARQGKNLLTFNFTVERVN